MKYIYFTLLCVVIQVSSLVSQTDTVFASFQYTMGDNDTRNDAKRIAFMEAKRLCIEKVGTYVSSKLNRQIKETVIGNKSDYTDITTQDATSLAGALVKVDIIKQAFNYVGSVQVLETNVKAIVDMSLLLKQVDEIKQNSALEKAIKEQQTQIYQLEGSLRKIQQQLSMSTPEKILEQRVERKVVFDKLDLVESIKFQIQKESEMAMKYVQKYMTKEEVRKLLGEPRGVGDYSRKWYYGSVEIYFSSDLVYSVRDQNK